MQQQYTVQEVLNALQTEEDKVYMSDLIEKMFKLGVVTQSRQEKGEIPRYITFAITNRCNLRCKHSSSPERSVSITKSDPFLEE